MRITAFMIIIFLALPIILFFMQYKLCKKKSKWALILPTIVASFSALVGYYTLILSAVMFLMYFVNEKLEKEKQSIKSEIEKMNIEDL